jgi:hypothetical protein
MLGCMKTDLGTRLRRVGPAGQLEPKQSTRSNLGQIDAEDAMTSNDVVLTCLVLNPSSVFAQSQSLSGIMLFFDRAFSA